MKKITLLVLCCLGMHTCLFAQWVSQTSGTFEDLNSVFFPAKDTGYIVGDYGTILKTTNGGINWAAQTSGTTQRLTSVYFTDVNKGFAVGWSGTIIKTVNGGNTWVTATTIAGTDNCVSVFFPSKNTGYIMAQGNNNNYKTTDGGTTWTAQPYSIYFTPGNFGSSLYCVDTLTGYNAGYGFFKTTDGGNTWVKIDSNHVVQAVYFLNADTGFSAGNGINKTTDGGVSWTTSQSTLSYDLFSVYFISADTGYAVGGDPINGSPGTILQTVDGGLNWTSQSIPTNSNWILYSVFFIPHTGDGYIVGYDGVILKNTTWGTSGLAGIKMVDDELSVYPNPANDKLKITYTGSNKIQVINLFDMLGKQIMQTEFKTIGAAINLDVSNLNEGVYFLKASAADKTFLKKIVITH